MARKGTRKTTDKTPDIRAVAAMAKVSIATVSRTINGSPSVSDRLTKRVWQAIEQLNYFPKYPCAQPGFGPQPSFRHHC